MLTCSGDSRSPALGSGRNFPLGQIGTGPWGFFAFLCSIEHVHLPGLLWATLAMFLAAPLAPPRHHLCPGSLWFSFPLQVRSRSKLCSSLLSISPDVLACAKQPVLRKAPGLLHHQELPLSSSPCMQFERRAGMRVLFMHNWPRSTAIFAGKKYVCVSSICVILLKIPHGTAHLFFFCV